MPISVVCSCSTLEYLLTLFSQKLETLYMEEDFSVVSTLVKMGYGNLRPHSHPIYCDQVQGDWVSTTFSTLPVSLPLLCPHLGAYSAIIVLEKDPKWSLRIWGPAYLSCCFSVQTPGPQPLGSPAYASWESRCLVQAEETLEMGAFMSYMLPLHLPAVLQNWQEVHAKCCFLGSVVLGSAWDDLMDFLLLGTGGTSTSRTFRMTLMTQTGNQGQEFLHWLVGLRENAKSLAKLQRSAR